MQEFLAPILFRVQNLFTVLSNEVQHINSDNIIYLLINGGGVFLGFFFVSRFFRAYILRLGFFMFGAWVLWNVSARDSILESFDFYGGLGMLLPQLEIVEITYLLLKERTLFVYNQVVGLILLLVSPLVWLYRQIARLSDYFKAKQGEREAKREQQKREQHRRYEEEKKQYQQSKQTKDKKPSSRWESTNPYEVLGIEEIATKSEIKKAYRKLAKLYHPDLALVNKEKAEEIFKMINRAYENLG